MTKYIDLVLCKHPDSEKFYIFYAPAWTYLKIGQHVLVETVAGASSATVVDSVTVEKDSELFYFIVKASGARMPLKKVISTVEYRTLEYKEEDNGTHNA